MKSDAALGGGIARAGALADKGFKSLGEQLLGQGVSP